MAAKGATKRADPVAVLEQVSPAQLALVRQVLGTKRNDKRISVWVGEVKRTQNARRGFDTKLSGRPETNEHGVVFLLATADLWHALTGLMPTGGAIQHSAFEKFAGEVATRLDFEMPSLRARRGAIRLWKSGYKSHSMKDRKDQFAWYPL
jgi:hypothetical protein